MKRRHTFSLDSKGDTIVEVLIAGALVGLVLTSAYALTNKNVSSIQNAQEQSMAQKLVEKQVELLRAAASMPSTTGCFSNSSYVATGNSACTVTVGGAQYKLAVSPPASGTVYVVEAKWVTLGGSDATVKMFYSRAI